MNVEALWGNHVYCLRPNGGAASSGLSYFGCFFLCHMCLIWSSQVHHMLTSSTTIFILLLIVLLLSRLLIHYFFFTCSNVQIAQHFQVETVWTLLFYSFWAPSSPRSRSCHFLKAHVLQESIQALTHLLLSESWSWHFAADPISLLLWVNMTFLESSPPRQNAMTTTMGHWYSHQSLRHLDKKFLFPSV